MVVERELALGVEHTIQYTGDYRNVHLKPI